jgi:hypothetical protein
MPTSEARIKANRANSLLSCGPKTPESKAISRRNGLKHGMTGQGVVLREVDAVEAERRIERITDEMAPNSWVSETLIREMAVLSVRMERGARQEFANVGEQVRHATTRYDAEQVERAQAILATIADDPAGTLRRLKRFPAGVNLLISTWVGMRADLTREPKPIWDTTWVGKMARLLGLREREAQGLRLGAIYRAIWGNFTELTDFDGAGLADEARKAWAKDCLIERIDQEIDKLDAHYQTLDLEAFDRDRAEAPDRALFDDSREAARARRYESEARRGFYRALEKLSQPEVEAIVEEEVVATSIAEAPAALASSCEAPVDSSPIPLELEAPPLWPPSSSFSRTGNFARTADGQVLSVGKPAQGPSRGSAPGR